MARRHTTDWTGSYPREKPCVDAAANPSWHHLMFTVREKLDRHEMQDWIIENTFGGWAFFGSASTQWVTFIQAHFEHLNDAILFKLRWR
jgi:hypothetical protein